ncbi:hypothetical protein GLOIN_2v1622415, partial [Rhizophagus irregularis DAOM 181602=DAOM 197198]
MINLVNSYRNGEGTEKNLEKAFYWHQKAAESNKSGYLIINCQILIIMIKEDLVKFIKLS